jgi:hypothetical protein
MPNDLLNNALGGLGDSGLGGLASNAADSATVTNFLSGLGGTTTSNFLNGGDASTPSDAGTTDTPADQGETLKDQYRPQTLSQNAYVKGYVENDQLIPDIIPTDTKQLDDYSVSNSMGKVGMRSYDDASFKYGVSDEFAISYEDPTYPKFQLSFTANDKDYLNLFPQASNFISAYSSINDIANRADILKEFNRIFFSIFDADFSMANIKNYNKSHYINSIDGLNKLNSKIVDYVGQKGLKPEGDYITITLSEDVSYLSLYLAELYNNLHYDYKGQRYLIPDNCMRFNMAIKINDIRSFKTKNPAFKAGDELSTLWIYDENISSMIYTLYDCNMVFAESQNIEDSLGIAGFGASAPSTPATLKFYIYYKSVDRQMSPKSITSAFTLNNKGTSSKDGMVKSNTNILDKNLVFDSKLTTNIEISDKSNKLKDKLLKTGKELISDAAELFLRKGREKRGEMVNSLLGEIRDTLNVPKIYPENVNDNNKNPLLNLVGSAASEFSNSLEDDIKNSLNSVGENAKTSQSDDTDMKNIYGSAKESALGDIGSSTTENIGSDLGDLSGGDSGGLGTSLKDLFGG